MSDNQRNFPQRKKHALDNYGFNLSVPVNGEQGKYSNLSWEISRNSLGIRVYTGYSADITGRQRGQIRATLSGIAFYGFLELLKQALSEKGEWKGKIEYTDFHFMNGGKRSNAAELISAVYVGRDEDGTIWISVIDAMNKDRPRIKFPFGAGRQYNFKHADGSDYTRADITQLFARAYYNFLSTAGSYVMVREYEEPKPRQNSGGGGGNNYNNNNRQNNNSGGGGGGNSDFDDQIPF